MGDTVLHPYLQNDPVFIDLIEGSRVAIAIGLGSENEQRMIRE